MWWNAGESKKLRFEVRKRVWVNAKLLMREIM